MSRASSKIKLWLLLIAAAAAAFGAVWTTTHKPPQWQEVVSEEGAFSVLMPGSPGPTKEIVATKAGPLEQKGVAVVRNGYEWWVRYVDTGTDVGREDLRIRMLETMRDHLMKTAQAKVVSETVASVNGHTGRQLHFAGLSQERMFIVRIFLVRQRVYVIGVGSSTKKDVPRDADKFFESFKLMPKN